VVPTTSPMLAVQPAARGTWRGSKSSLDLGRQGRCLHAHMHRAQGVHCYRSRYAQASCHAAQTQRWSTAVAASSRSCRPAVLPCQVAVKTRPGWGKRRCEHLGEGAGLEKRVGYIPSREQLVQEQGLTHTCLHPCSASTQWFPSGQ